MMKQPIKRIINSMLFDVLFPANCNNCGKHISNNDYGICGKCRTLLSECTKLYSFDQIKLIEEDIHGLRCWYIDDGIWMFDYNEYIAKLIYSMKFRKNRVLAFLFAEYMSTVLASCSWQFDLITYVPISQYQLWERGFNQSHNIAYHLGKLLGKDVKGLLYIAKNLISQKKLSSYDRFITTYEKFDIFKNRTNISNRSILLIDDVYTTGATVNECARILKSHGASNVYVSIIAYAMLKDTHTNVDKMD